MYTSSESTAIKGKIPMGTIVSPTGNPEEDGRVKVDAPGNLNGWMPLSVGGKTALKEEDTAAILRRVLKYRKEIIVTELPEDGGACTAEKKRHFSVRPGSITYITDDMTGDKDGRTLDDVRTYVEERVKETIFSEGAVTLDLKGTGLKADDYRNLIRSKKTDQLLDSVPPSDIKVDNVAYVPLERGGTYLCCFKAIIKKVDGDKVSVKYTGGVVRDLPKSRVIWAGAKFDAPAVAGSGGWMYDSFLFAGSEGNVSEEYKKKHNGGHAIMIVGWRVLESGDSKRLNGAPDGLYWLCVNSWGTNDASERENVEGMMESNFVWVHTDHVKLETEPRFMAADPVDNKDFPALVEKRAETDPVAKKCRGS